MMRGIGAIVLLLLIAAAVAVGVIALTSKETGVKLREVGGNTVDDVSKQIQQLVNDNKK
jgi:archaellin